MSFRFCDSFAHYNGSLMYRKWTNPGNNDIVSSGGRRNAPYYSGLGGFNKTLTPQNNWILGCAATIPAFTQGTLLSLYNGGSIIIGVAINADATVSVVDQHGDRMATSTVAVTYETWNYYEFSCVLSGGTGTLTATTTVRVNGDPIIATSGTLGITGDFLFPGNVANGVGIAGAAGTQGWGFQDFYCIDTYATDINGNTSTNTAFFGDVEVDALFPDQNETITWSTFGGSGGAGQDYTCINEASPDDDTSYLYTSNTGSNESFEYQPISSFTGTIFAAQYLTCCKKDAEGLRTMAMTVNGQEACTSNFAITTGSNTSTTNYLSDYYVYYIAPLDSCMGTAWTTNVYNTATFGVVVTT